MADRMLTELYRRVFEEKKTAELPGIEDRARQVAIEKNKLLADLIDYRTDMLRHGLD
jgi:hypothetical protein